VPWTASGRTCAHFFLSVCFAVRLPGLSAQEFVEERLYAFCGGLSLGLADLD